MLTLVAAISGCVGRPGFIPTTRHLYDRFTPLAEPRPEVPVGALWIEGYGATGEGAVADNIVTTRSLSGFTFDADFQASLTLGLLKFLDLDPSYRKKVLARFADLSIIQVKDWSKLSGPVGEPRIYEALKAGTISITATGTAGLDIESRALSQDTPVIGRGTTGLARTFVIDGKDLVFAIHVASYRPVRTEPVRVTVSRKRPQAASLSRYTLLLSAAADAHALDPGLCLQRLDYRLQSRGRIDPSPAGMIELDAKGGEKLISMPVPEEGLGGALLTDVRVSWKPEDKQRCSVRTIDVQRTGFGVVTQQGSHAPGW
jgi:hypothetical protein